MITSDLYGFLKDQSPITALCPASSIQLAPADLTVSGFPLLTFATATEAADILFDGSRSLVKEEVIFQCAAKSPINAHLLADAVIGVLCGYVGAIGSRTVSMCYTSSMSDAFDETSAANFVNLTLTFWHRPT